MLRMSARYLLFLVLVVVLYAAWNYRERSAEVTKNQYFLDERQLAVLSQRAKDRDCAAAFKISMHYMHAKEDPDSALPWLRIAASCHDLTSQSWLAVTLIGRGEQSEELDQVIAAITEKDPVKGEQYRKEAAAALRK